MNNTLSRSIIFAVILYIFISSICIVSYADDSGTEACSDVLSDLELDETFNIDNYLSNSKDHSLKVIQIAESKDNELLVYVYQPSNDSIQHVASEIRLSIPEVGEDSYWDDYTLTLLSTNGVFCKYKVDGVIVDSTKTIRYYDITAIFRPWNEDIDDPSSYDGQVIDSVPYEVAQRWTAITSDETVKYTMSTTEVVTITDKIVGRIEYSNGFHLYGSWCDSHFVAFSCNYDIDKLMEADVYYVYQDYVRSTGIGLSGEAVAQGDPLDDVAYLNADNSEGSSEGDGWFSDSYTWSRIESISDFLSDSDGDGKTDSDIIFSTGTTETLKKQQWMLRFIETDRSIISSGGYSTEFWTAVSNVSILRLKFEVDGETYNLGVVDNKQTGPDSSLGTVTPDVNFDIDFGIFDFSKFSLENLWESTKKIVSIILFVLLLVIIKPFKLLRKIFNNLSKDKK